MSAEYRAKGCTCWPEPKASDPSDVYWAPNASCRHHGILADYQAARMETGTYQVVESPRSGGCFCSVNSGVLCDYCEHNVVRLTPPRCGTHRAIPGTLQCRDCGDGIPIYGPPSDTWYPAGPPGEPADGVYRFDGATTEKKETGVLAAVRYWFRWHWIWNAFRRN